MADNVRAADRLANERTFLAYLRTALSLVAFGFVIARFALLDRELGASGHAAHASASVSVPFGTAVALAGSALAVFGGYRYLAADRALEAGENAGLAPRVAYAGAAAVAVVGIAVAIVIALTR